MTVKVFSQLDNKNVAVCIYTVTRVRACKETCIHAHVTRVFSHVYIV